MAGRAIVSIQVVRARSDERNSGAISGSEPTSPLSELSASADRRSPST